MVLSRDEIAMTEPYNEFRNRAYPEIVVRHKS